MLKVLLACCFGNALANGAVETCGAKGCCSEHSDAFVQAVPAHVERVSVSFVDDVANDTVANDTDNSSADNHTAVAMYLEEATLASDNASLENSSVRTGEVEALEAVMVVHTRDANLAFVEEVPMARAILEVLLPVPDVPRSAERVEAAHDRPPSVLVALKSDVDGGSDAGTAEFSLTVLVLTILTITLAVGLIVLLVLNAPSGEAMSLADALSPYANAYRPEFMAPQPRLDRVEAARTHRHKDLQWSASHGTASLAPMRYSQDLLASSFTASCSADGLPPSEAEPMMVPPTAPLRSHQAVFATTVGSEARLVPPSVGSQRSQGPPASNAHPAPAITSHLPPAPSATPASPGPTRPRSPRSGGSARRFCPELVVPPGNEAILHIASPVGNDVDVKDLAGMQVVKIKLFPQAKGQAATVALYSANTVQPGMELCTCRSSTSHASRGQRAMEAVTSSNEVFAAIFKVDELAGLRQVWRGPDASGIGEFRPCYVLAPVLPGASFLYSGNFQEYAVQVQNEAGELVADMEPMDVGGVRLRVSSHGDVGLVLCALFAITLLERR